MCLNINHLFSTEKKNEETNIVRTHYDISLEKIRAKVKSYSFYQSCRQ